MRANIISSVNTIGTRNMAGVLDDREVEGRNAVSAIGHDAYEIGDLVKESGGGTTGETNGTVPAGDVVILQPREAESAASV